MKQMSKHRFLLTLLLLIFVCVSAKGQLVNEKANEKIDQIEASMYRDPVAANRELLQLLKEGPGLPNYTKGVIYINLATTYGMTNKLDSALYAIQLALQLLPEKELKHGAALRLLAIFYRLKGDYSNAEMVIKKTIQLNDSLWKDPFQKVLTMQEYASLCLDRRSFHQGTSLYLEAIQIASSPTFNDPKGNYTLIKLRTNLAEAYLYFHNYDFAIREFKIALPQLDSVQDFEGYLRTGIALSVAYMGANNYDACDQLLSDLQLVAVKVDNKELQSYLWIQQGVLLAARKDNKSALNYYRKAYEILKSTRSPELISECVNNYLTSLDASTQRDEGLNIINDPVVITAAEKALPVDRLNYLRQAMRFLQPGLSAAEANSYLQEILVLTDSVNAEKNRHSAAELQAKYQFEKQQEAERLLTSENKLLKDKADLKRYQLYLIISIAILATIILGLNIQRLRQRALLQSNELKAKQQEKIMADQLMNQQKEVLTQAIAEKEEMSHKLKELEEGGQENRRAELLEQLEKIKDKKLNLEVLISQFNMVYPSFATNLLVSYPKLSRSDVLYCSLVRMNLTTKEISIVMNIEPRSSYIKKYRIIEKMGLSEVGDFEKVVFGI